MNSLHKAAQQALEALCLPCPRWNGTQSKIVNNAIDALRAALAGEPQAQQTPSVKLAGLVDDLCLLHLGWKSDAEGDIYCAAQDRVVARALEAKRLRSDLVDHAEPVADELSGYVKTFFEDYLNIREESESGRIFAPIQISCCRAHKLEKLGALLERMRVLSGAEPVVEYEEP